MASRAPRREVTGGIAGGGLALLLAFAFAGSCTPPPPPQPDGLPEGGVASSPRRPPPTEDGAAGGPGPSTTVPDGRAPTTPLEPIVFGTQLCDSCRMVIAAPAFAVQVYSADGRVSSFDDPGCLVIEMETGRAVPLVFAFHHADADRWLSDDQVGFVRRAATPMEFGYAAVDAADAELTFAELRAELRARFGLTR